ncbi:hypothetical protein Tco_1350714, partial [Tanacetum coccineum]
APRGVPVGLKVGFKQAKEYRPISKKLTSNTNDIKKKGVGPTKEVSNLNLFDVLNSVENDGELGTNEGTSNLASNEANSSGSSFWNVENSITSNTPIVAYPGDHDSEDEVELVDNDMAQSMTSEMAGFGTTSLQEQWRDSYKNGDYDEDPYDDDIHEGTQKEAAGTDGQIVEQTKLS